MTNQTHHRCPGCDAKFEVEQLICDENFEPQGMQFLGGDTGLNVFYFNHICRDCGSTFVLPVTVFFPFIDEPIPETVLAGTKACSQHCLNIKDLNTCDKPCTYAPFRRFLVNTLMKLRQEKSLNP